ncbi:MAG: efflux RND transporter periplasmic adaptor subunit [Candidatus Gracilibacteria bacterium]
MRPQFNLKYFTFGMLVILIINYSTFLGTTETIINTVGSTSLTIELGDIQNSIEVVGDAELVDEQSLSFNQAGTITTVNFKAGDTIRKGETIAEIDNSDAYDSIENAKISLQNAQISLKQLYEDVDESKIIQAKNTITTSENSLENSKVEFKNIKITQENSLNKLLEDIETSKKELANLIKEKENSLSDTTLNKNKTIISIEDDFRTNLDEIEKIIKESDYIMGVTIENKDENDDFENYLGAKNTTIKNDAKKSLLESINLYNSLKVSLENYYNSGGKEKIEGILNEYLVIFNKLYETTDYIYKTAEVSIISIGSLTQSEIDSMKNTMSTYRSSSLNKVSSIKSSINTLNTLTDTELLGDSNEITIEKQAISIKNSIKSYDETVSNYKLTIEEKQQSIENKVVSLDVAKLNLEELIEGPTDDNITKANNTIKQANIKLSSAYESLEDYMLQAPFDGVIRKIDYMPGDNLTNDTDKYVYIENPNLLEISVMLDQIDIVTVELGQEAIVTFDTYSTIPVKAKISSIDTTPIQSSGVVSYEVKLVLDDPNFDKKILSGMTSNVEIIIESKENILVIKTSALVEKNGKNYLTVEKNGEETEIEVEIGIASSGMTEIISGVNEGDTVIVKEFVPNTSEEETSTSLFGGGGDRSGPPGGF